MPRNVTLSRLLEDLAAETGETTNPNSRSHVRSYYVQLLQRKQRQLWQSYDWPFLRVWRDVNLAKGQKTYDFPSDLDLNRIEGAWTNYSRHWIKVIRLLEPPDYAYFDSDEGEEFNPQMRWYLREDGDFEVWPIPSDNDRILRFVGIKDLSPLVDDADTCDLDSDLIVMFAAAQVLARRKAPDAQLVAAEAQSHLRRIKARLAGRHGFRMNETLPPSEDRRYPFGPKPIDFTQG